MKLGVAVERLHFLGGIGGWAAGSDPGAFPDSAQWSNAPSQSIACSVKAKNPFGTSGNVTSPAVTVH